MSTLALVLYAFVPVALVQWIALLMLFVAITSALWSRSIRNNLHVSRAAPEQASFRFQDCEVHVRIENRSAFPIAHLSLTDPCGRLRADGRTSAVISLKAGQEYNLRYTVRGINRGVHELGPLRVRGTDPLGLFPWAGVAGEPGRIIVYPALHPLTLSYSRGLPAGNLSTANPVYEDPTRFRSLRGYIRGDDPRRISWKATARTGELHTTEYLPALSFPLIVLLNLRAGHYETRKRFHAVERNIEAAAALVMYARRLEQPVGLVIDGKLGKDTGEHGYPATAGYAHAVELLSALARADIADGLMDVAELRQAAGSVPYGARIFYVGPPLDAETVIALTNMAQGETTIELLYNNRKTAKRESFVPRSVPIRSIPEYGAFRFVG
ncbi:MAG: DUF58 domain-containing protein [Spirochaetales bacterium]